MNPQIELRHLRYFLAVAEELNFSRAARRLRIAQPALSAQIRTLESQLGCELFERTTRRVALTDAGCLLLEDASEIVRRVDASIARLRSAARGEAGVLRIGFLGHGAGEVGRELLGRFASDWPGVETRLVEGVTLEEIQRHLLERASDVAFAWLPLLSEELEAVPLRYERLFVCLHPEHRLAVKAELTLAEVAVERIVAEWDAAPWELLRPWLGELRPQGRRTDDPLGRQLSECLALVSQGLAVYCVPDSVPRFFARPDLVYRPVVDAAPSPVAVAWRRDTTNPAVGRFVELARALAEPAADAPVSD